MNMVALAWRNLLRNRRRSLMTLSAMILGLVAVFLGQVREGLLVRAGCAVEGRLLGGLPGLELLSTHKSR